MLSLGHLWDIQVTLSCEEGAMRILSGVLRMKAGFSVVEGQGWITCGSRCILT
jgi:hypothetical protein